MREILFFSFFLRPTVALASSVSLSEVICLGSIVLTKRDRGKFELVVVDYVARVRTTLTSRNDLTF